MLPERPVERCGIFGVFGMEEAARTTYFGLFALQHRGQESAGIASSYGKYLFIHKDAGLVSSVFREKDIRGLKGDRAIGHVRYSTSRGSSTEQNQHSQPVDHNENFVLVHNGNLPLTRKLEDFLEEKGVAWRGCNDTELLYEAINYNLKKGAPLVDAVTEVYSLTEGVYAALAMTPKELVVFQDKCAMKPLSLGKLDNALIFSSETCALDTVNAKFIRDIGPGEIMSITTRGDIETRQAVSPHLKRDSWEFVYFARPDSIMLGQGVYETREKFGRILAQEYPTSADLVIGIPHSGVPAAIGFSNQSKIPYIEGIIKNRYIGRSFIEPSTKLREDAVKLKLNPIPKLLEGKKVVVVDDSIVRGTTTPRIIKLLKKAGVVSVDVRISAPPYKYPDYYGTDTPIQDNLIASQKSVEEIRSYIGADSLGYLSYEGLISGIGLPEDVLSVSWFTGEYPIKIR